ncbi:MAG: hypothetical protein IJ993_06220, partial [Akkermansia sp.]|nr:hypothetical protein [Akkermansia sp.]
NLTFCYNQSQCLQTLDTTSLHSTYFVTVHVTQFYKIQYLIIIEKSFQNGGNELRRMGIHVESLAIVDSLDNCTIQLHD